MKKSTTAAKTIALPKLQKGEVWGGLLLVEGKPTHHVIKLAGEVKGKTWDQAVAWAKKHGGALPTRKEARLLHTNAPEAFEKEAYWTSEPYAGDDACAWGQWFGNGGQDYWHKSTTDRAFAVRRVAI